MKSAKNSENGYNLGIPGCKSQELSSTFKKSFCVTHSIKLILKKNRMILMRLWSWAKFMFHDSCHTYTEVNFSKSFRTIQVLAYNSLVVARQNVPITSILTNCTLGSWKDFDVDLSLIGPKKWYGKPVSIFTTFSKQSDMILTRHLQTLEWKVKRFNY